MSTLSLLRKDLAPAKGGGCSGRSLSLLKASSQKASKVIVGRDDGSVTCFSMKKGEHVDAFVTKTGKAQVTCVHSHVNKDGKDRILLCSGSSLIGITKKNKKYKEYKHAGGSQIKMIWGDDSDIWYCTEFAVGHLANWKDVETVSVRDQITCMTVNMLADGESDQPIVGCFDSTVRVINDGDVRDEVLVKGPVTTLATFKTLSSMDGLGISQEVLYGTKQGIFGNIIVDNLGASAAWELHGPSAVCCACAGDLTGDGSDELVVAFDNGDVEVFRQSSRGAPTKIASMSVGQSATDLQVGFVSSLDYPEIVISTFGGKVVSLTSEPLSEDGYVDRMQVGEESKKQKQKKPATGDGASSAGGKLKGLFGGKKEKSAETTSAPAESLEDSEVAPPSSQPRQEIAAAPAASTSSSNNANVAQSALDADGFKIASRHISVGELQDQAAEEIARTKAAEEVRVARERRDGEIRALEKELQTLRESVKSKEEKFTQSVSAQGIAATTSTKVRHSVQVDCDKALMVLSIEADIAIEVICLSCKSPLSLVDCGDAVPAITPTGRAAGNFQFLCTLRMKEAVSQVTVRLRCRDGISDVLNVMVAPRASPKVSHSIDVNILPLSMHERTSHKTSPSFAVSNCLSVTGDFGLGEVHSWISRLLPSVPMRPDEGGSALYYKSALDGSQLQLEYKAGSIECVSDNAGTIAVINDHLSLESRSRSTRIQSSTRFDDGSSQHFVSLVHSRLQAHHDFASKLSVLEALKDIQAQEPDTSFMQEKHLQTIKMAGKLKADADSQLEAKSALHQCVVDFWTHLRRLRSGRSSGTGKSEEQLRNLLNSYSQQGLIAFLDE